MYTRTAPSSASILAASGRAEAVHDPWRYVPVLTRKPGALRNGALFKKLGPAVIAGTDAAQAARFDDMEMQRRNVRKAVAALAPLIEAGHQLIITHGNGLQVGLLALQAAAAPAEGSHSLDMLGTRSEGLIGYLINGNCAMCCRNPIWPPS